MQTQRPPIVTVLGHVDHGKTSLLDAVRQTNIAKKEAGGITQSIGASMLTTPEGKNITFIDTPGHAAFSQMRSRGAKVADIAVLVVAADDGVKPQTREALEHLKSAKIPFIVALTKTDLQTASIEQSLTQLEKEEVFFEGRGGDVPYVAVSAKTGSGIKELLEIISLLAEVTELKADAQGPLEAVVIETSRSKKGMITSVVVRNGSLNVGSKIYALDLEAKIRGMFDQQARPVRKVLPGQAVALLGFDRLPPIGVTITDMPSDSTTQVSKKINIPKRIEEGEVAVLVKAGNAGALEAVLSNLPEAAVVMHASVGDVNESDVLMAKNSGAQITAFESKIASSSARLAEMEGVKAKSFNIIYELLNYLEEEIEKTHEEILGKAEIVDVFPFNNKKVAGSKVAQGKIGKEDTVFLYRGDKQIGQVKIISLKKQKQDIAEVKQGEEFGVIFVPQLDFDKGDMLVSVRK